VNEADQLELAILIAVIAHMGQLDRAGRPYILHPFRVMMAVSTDEERMVAALHDVVEDNPKWSIARLDGHGFSASVLAAVDAMTRRPGENYRDYISRVGSNDIATSVKLADLHDNSDINRIGPEKMTEADWSLMKRYGRAATKLLELRREKSNAA
jgi:(p)ppGpp synthase/HD superfamily hydrolase